MKKENIQNKLIFIFDDFGTLFKTSHQWDASGASMFSWDMVWANQYNEV